MQANWLLPPTALLLASLAMGLVYVLALALTLTLALALTLTLTLSPCRYSAGVGLLAYTPLLLSIDRDVRHGREQQAELNATTFDAADVYGEAAAGASESGGGSVWATHPLLLLASLASFGGALACGTALLALTVALGIASVLRKTPLRLGLGFIGHQDLLGRAELWLGGTALLLCATAAAAATAALGGGAEGLIESNCRTLLRQTDEACLRPASH